MQFVQIHCGSGSVWQFGYVLLESDMYFQFVIFVHFTGASGGDDLDFLKQELVLQGAEIKGCQ